MYIPQSRQKMKSHNRAIRRHAARTLSAQNVTVLEPVHVCQITLVIHIVVVVPNVLPTMIVHALRHVWTTNAMTHVRVFVAQMPNVVWSIMHRNAHALSATLEIHWAAAMNHHKCPVRCPQSYTPRSSSSNPSLFFSTLSHISSSIMRICDKLVRDVLENPCVPSPCGLNSQCRVVQDHAVCSCTPGYIGSAPNCRPECVVSSECAQDRACVKQKCVDPCPSTCGLNARCQVVNHNPICSCSPGFTGDPFIQCSPERKCPIQSIWLTHHPHQLQSIQCQNKSRFTLTETFLIIRDTLMMVLRRV